MSVDEHTLASNVILTAAVVRIHDSRKSTEGSTCNLIDGSNVSDMPAVSSTCSRSPL